MLRHRPMTERECREYLARKLDEDSRCRAAAEFCTLDAARREVAGHIAYLLPSGLRTDGHTFWTLLAEDGGKEREIGALWFQQEPNGDVRLWGIDIDPDQRRRGFAASALALAEEEARRLGARIVRLHVFPQNQAAQALYRKRGFSPTNVYMAKPLDPQ